MKEAIEFVGGMIGLTLAAGTFALVLVGTAWVVKSFASLLGLI